MVTDDVPQRWQDQNVQAGHGGQVRQLPDQLRIGRRKGDDQGAGIESGGDVHDVVAGPADPDAIDPQAVLGPVVVQQRDREVAAVRVMHHAAQQAAAGVARAEDDDASFVVPGGNMPAAPGADDEARGEHAHQGQDPGDHRDAARDVHVVGEEHEEHQPAARGEGGPGEVDGLLEGAAPVADRVRAHDRADDSIGQAC